MGLTVAASSRLSSSEKCERLGVRLFMLPPRSPKLNGHASENSTHTEKFYETHDGDLQVGPPNRALRRWEQVYNTMRPHHSLGYLTPNEYLRRTVEARAP